MFITKSKYNEELRKLQKEINSLRSTIDTDRKKIQELKAKLRNELEIAYNYNFPQNPKRIIVSKYVAEKFLKNKATFVPRYPFPDYQYEGLNIKVDNSLQKLQVLFEAEWEEPPVVCKNCGQKKDYEFSYPKDNPQFCDHYCFEDYINKNIKEDNK